MQGLLDREREVYLSRHTQSLSLWERGRACMPAGVPMSWMTNLYRIPPVYVERGEGVSFVDVDGNHFIDFNQADMSAQCGYGTEAIVCAATERMKKGAHFLLPTSDSIEVSEELCRRFGLPMWQYTLSASSAVSELIRISRYLTNREAVLMFDGGYHGHSAEELLIELDENGGKRNVYRGLEGEAREREGEEREGERDRGRRRGRERERALIVEYNDLESACVEVRKGVCACVIVEGAITNSGIILPKEGFLKGLYDVCRETGTFLLLDETHTQVCGPGGLKGEWGLSCDGIILGKMLGGGVPIGAYGMTEEMAKAIDPFEESLPIGGTLFGNALSLACARASLSHVMTFEAFQRVRSLGERLAQGMEASIHKHGLGWCVQRLMCRVGVTFHTQTPTTHKQAGSYAAPHKDLFLFKRFFFANRGIWEAIDSAGPCISFAATDDDVSKYLDVFEEFACACAYHYRV